MKRTLLIAAAVVLLVAGGVFAYTRFRPKPVTARGDPAVMVAVAIGALERSQTYALTGEQVGAVLPLLRVLRDTDPGDVEASRALAQEIMNIFTPEQRAEIERLRQEAQARRQAQGGQQRTDGQRSPGGPGAAGPGGGGFGGPGFGPGGPGAGAAPGAGPGGAAGRSRVEVRQRVLGRLIERLEGRVR